MTTATVLAIVGLGGVIALAGALVATRARLYRLEARVRSLDARVADEIAPAVDAARQDARVATATARRAASAAGIEEPPARVPFEPIVGPVVRAVALGAGAGRALHRLTRPSIRRRSR